MGEPCTEDRDARAHLVIKLLKLGSVLSQPMTVGLCQPMGLTQSELKILMALEGEGALAGCDLSKVLGIPAMTVSRSAALLKRRGWVEEQELLSNRRRKLFALTDAGREAHAQVMAHLHPIGQDLLCAFDPTQIQALAATADTISEEAVRWAPRSAANP